MIEKLIHAGTIDSEEIISLRKVAKQKNISIVFLDTTFVLPTSEENITENFEHTHIPEAQFFDIKAISNKKTDLPHMIPNKAQIENALSDLGITNTDLIIVYGQHGMIMGPARVWWMLKGFGHDNIIVLNGGLPAWIKAGNLTQIGIAAKPNKTSYKASNFNDDMLVNMTELIEISNNKQCPIIDARPNARFNGATPEPRDGMRSGHIPNSKNMPCSLLVDEEGKLKKQDTLLKLFENSEVHLNSKNTDRIVTTCGSGITACALALALYHLKHENVSVYDGSWAEWGLKNSPTEVMVRQSIK